MGAALREAMVAQIAPAGQRRSSAFAATLPMPQRRLPSLTIDARAERKQSLEQQDEPSSNWNNSMYGLDTSLLSALSPSPSHRTRVGRQLVEHQTRQRDHLQAERAACFTPRGSASSISSLILSQSNRTFTTTRRSQSWCGIVSV